MGRGDDQEKLVAVAKRHNPFKQVIAEKTLKEEQVQAEEERVSEKREEPTLKLTPEKIEELTDSIWQSPGGTTTTNNPLASESEAQRLGDLGDKLRVTLEEIEKDPAAIYSKETLEKISSKKIESVIQDISQTIENGWSKEDLKRFAQPGGTRSLQSFDHIPQQIQEDIASLKEALEISEKMLEKIDASLAKSRERQRAIAQALKKSSRSSSGDDFRKFLLSLPQETLSKIDESLLANFRGPLGSSFPPLGLDDLLDYEHRGLEVVLQSLERGDQQIVALLDPRTSRSGKSRLSKKHSLANYLIFIIEDEKIVNQSQGEIKYSHNLSDFFSRNRDDTSDDYATLKNFSEKAKQMVAVQVEQMCNLS